MCGIAGLVCARAEAPRGAADFVRILEHRGPDDHGWLTAADTPAAAALQIERGRGACPLRPAQVLLAHRRLSILDLSDAGWQPMSTPEGRFHIVFNGEIYNYVELREELSRLGQVFRSQGDTEVLLHACAAWGPRALTRLVGMFAFALLDSRRRTLLLARDFFGIKPLYYTRWPGGLAFASEIKALLHLPQVSRRVHAQRLHQYLTTGVTDHGSETMFADIRQVPGAHFLEVPLDAPQRAEPVAYWRLPLGEALDISYDEATTRVRELFLDNVRLHLRSDVPVGAALSGGIDSSAIVAAMRALAPRLDLHTFSYVAEDPALSEEKWADVAARHARAVAHKVQPAPGELAADLDQLIACQDEPFGSTSIYAQHRVFRLARAQGIKVMLDGQGADEMLGGYRYYLSARLASLVKQGHWLEAGRFLRRAAHQPGTGRLALLRQAAGLLVSPRLKNLGKQWLQRSVMPSWLDARWFAHQGIDSLSTSRFSTRNLLRGQLHRTLFESSLPMLLRYEDRNSMAHSIESRVPFLTPALAEFVLQLPEHFIIGPDGTSKRIFRDAMRGLVPDEILERRDKVGFVTPEKSWLADLRPWVERTLSSDAAHAIPALVPHVMLQEWHDVLAGRRPFDFRVWRWVNAIRWAERFHVSFAAPVARAA